MFERRRDGKSSLGPLESSRDSPLSPEFSTPERPTSVRKSLRSADMVEAATNDMSPLPSIAETSAAPVATSPAAIASDENAPDLLFESRPPAHDRQRCLSVSTRRHAASTPRRRKADLLGPHQILVENANRH